MCKRNLIIITVTSLLWVFTITTFSQLKTPPVAALTSTRIAKSQYLSQGNVAKSVPVNFDKRLKDATGKMRRIQIGKVEYLKPYGFRYYAKVDGQARNISYLLIEKETIAMINVEGNRPEHNLYMPTYEVKNGLMTEIWTRGRLLSEIPAFWGKEARFSMIENYVDAHSFALLAIAPNQIKGMKPGELFDIGRQPSTSANPNTFNRSAFGNIIGEGAGIVASNQLKGVKPAYLWETGRQPSANVHTGLFRPAEFKIPNIFSGGAIQIDCNLRKENRIQCTGGCAPVDEPAEDEAWQIFGSRKRQECQAAGCQMCAGICCQPDKCTSVEVFVLDCGGSGSAN